MMYSSRRNRPHALVRCLCFMLLLLGSSLLFSTYAFAASPRLTHQLHIAYQTITPPTSNEVLINPGQGWVLYGTPANQTAETMAYASVGYTRYNWSQIEPAEGVYKWSVIDHDLAAWHAAGKRFAFGVMNANSSDPQVAYVTPRWVFKDGATAIKTQTYDTVLGRKGTQYVPVWDNPIFLRKVRDFVTALAHRYDGSPDIAYIDIRSYGNWGSQKVDGLPHSVALSPAKAQIHDEIYRNAFKHTQLILPWSTSKFTSDYTWAVKHNIGLRRDSILLYSNGSELLPAYRKAPIVFEFYGGYQWLVRKGYWNNNKLLRALSNGKPSYVSMGLWGNDAQAFLAKEPQIIQQVANMIGYHFVLSSATLPTTITNSQASTISLSWKNQGVAYLTQPASVAIALLDQSNNLVQKQWLTKAQPQNWAPGKTTATSASITFKNVPAGTYNLAVGLFLHTTDSKPTYKIGNQGRTNDGWYALSTVTVQ